VRGPPTCLPPRLEQLVYFARGSALLRIGDLNAAHRDLSSVATHLKEHARGAERAERAAAEAAERARADARGGERVAGGEASPPVLGLGGGASRLQVRDRGLHSVSARRTWHPGEADL
jgi:hypothetical protein